VILYSVCGSPTVFAFIIQRLYYQLYTHTHTQRPTNQIVSHRHDGVIILSFTLIADSTWWSSTYYINIGPSPPFYLPIRYNSITHKRVLLYTYSRGLGHVFLFFFRAPFFPLHYYRYIILCRVRAGRYGHGVPTHIHATRTARVSRSVFFQLPRDFRTDAAVRTHKTTVVVVSVRLRFRILYLYARASVCVHVIYVRQSWAVFNIVFIYHPVQSRGT